MSSALSMHASYRCQHAGACCRSGWTIPIEGNKIGAVRRALDAGGIAVKQPWLLSAADRPVESGGLLRVRRDGHCVFHQQDRCAIHGVLGPARLPSACQQFPRIWLIDPRGTFVTLSHYCPTAASLLFDERPVSVVELPASWHGDAVPEGLDARETWPPLLTERVLMDHESFALWERHAVALLAGETSAGHRAETVLARLRTQTLALCRWTPRDGALIEAVRTMAETRREVISGDPPAMLDLGLFDIVRGAVPPELAWPAAPGAVQRIWRARVAPAWPEWAPVVRRFLAAHVFGSWLAYQGRGLQTLVHGLEAACAVLQVELVRACVRRETCLTRSTLHEAVRQADLLLRHHADRQVLADTLSSGHRPCS